MATTGNSDGALRDELAKLDEAFAGEQVKNDQAPVPDGRYHAEVERVILTRSQSQEPMLQWSLVIITEGPHANRRVWYYRTINPKTLKWLKQDLVVCGLDVPRISDVADYLPQLTGAKLDITVKTKGDRRNIYLNRRLDTPEATQDVFSGGDDFPV